MKIELAENLSDYIQSAQLTKMVFAFVSAPKFGNKQLFWWVKCRDFLADAVRASVTKTPFRIYRFNFINKAKSPLDTRRVRLLVSFENYTNNSASIINGSIAVDKKELRENKVVMRMAQTILNHFEEKNGLRRTTIKYIPQDGVPMWYVNGPSIWLRSPALISLFTLLIRSAKLLTPAAADEPVKWLHYISKLDKGTKTKDYPKTLSRSYSAVSSDYSMINQVYQHIDAILSEAAGKRGFAKAYTRNTSRTIFHYNAGVVTFCTMLTRRADNEIYRCKDNGVKALFA